MVGTEGMIAGDLLEFLPAAVEQLKTGDEDEETTHEHGAHEHEHVHD